MTPSLLLVEDDPIEARRLESTLSHMGYAVVCVADGDAALARLAAEAFDVVLLDLVVPGLDGMGVLRAMAARGLKVPVVVQVTSAGLDAASGAIRAGARDFVVKPAGALRLEIALANAAALGRYAHHTERGFETPAPAPQATRPEAIRTEPVRADAVGNVAVGNVIRFAPAHAPAPAAVQDVPDAAYARLDAAGHARRLEQIEAEAIRFACTLYGGRLAEVARRLGIGRSTLYRKLAELQPETVGENLSMEPNAARFVAAE